MEDYLDSILSGMVENDRGLTWALPDLQPEACFACSTEHCEGDEIDYEYPGTEFAYNPLDAGCAVDEVPGGDNFPIHGPSSRPPPPRFVDRYEELTNIEYGEYDLRRLANKLRRVAWFPLQTKSEPWKDEFRKLIHSSSEGGFGFYSFAADEEAGALQERSNSSLVRLTTNNLEPPIAPSTSYAGPFKEFMLAGDGNVLCINMGEAQNPGKLIVYNPESTQKLNHLPPLIHPRNPVLLHVCVHDRAHYSVIAAGGNSCTATGISSDQQSPGGKTEVYDSVTGEWKICSELPNPGFGLTEYQTGAFYKDSESRKFLCCVADLNKDGTKGVLLFDLKQNQWVQDSIQRCIPLVRGKNNKGSVDVDVKSHIASAQTVGCGGSIFVFSEQVLYCHGPMDDQTYYCIHKLNPDSFDADDMWKDIYEKERSGSTRPDLPGGFGQMATPEFPCAPLSATVVERGESVFVFSEQESGESDVCICIHTVLKRDHDHGSGGGHTWEEIMRFKRPRRHRSSNWKGEEIFAYLKSKEEGLEVVEGKDWEYISKRLEGSYGFNRGPKACEDQWGTLLKRHTKLNADLHAKNIRPNSSGWAKFWKQFKDRNKKSNSKLAFNLECYETMSRILSKKPRKKSCAGGHKLEPVLDADAGPSSPPDYPLHDSLAPPATTTTMSPIRSTSSEAQVDEHRQAGSATIQRSSLVLCKLLVDGGQNWTNEQRLEIRQQNIEILKQSNKERELEVELLKLQPRRNRLKARELANPKKSRKRKLSK